MTAGIRLVLLLGLPLLAVPGCRDGAPDAPVESGAESAPAAPVLELPEWTFEPTMIFPADRSLLRPEDGVALPDGRLLVADQEHGLRLVRADGTNRPFGRFTDAGYTHRPPDHAGGANGVTLEPSGSHVLVADIFHGGIYRVDVASEETELLHQHAFGVNMARADSRGGVWFTRSTRNTPEEGEAGIVRALAAPAPDGAVYHLPPGSGDAGGAVLVADSLQFPNGIALDEQVGHLYVAETTGDRVLRFPIDVAGGTLGEPTPVLELSTPDNIELESPSRLWIASPSRSEVVVWDLESGVATSVFRVPTPGEDGLLPKLGRRFRSVLSIFGLDGPDAREPAPGSITGIVFSPDDGPVYLTTLGDALIRLPR